MSRHATSHHQSINGGGDLWMKARDLHALALDGKLKGMSNIVQETRNYIQDDEGCVGDYRSKWYSR